VRIGTALVRGPSMVPALRDGDCVVVRRGARVRPGDVVVARYRSRPDLLVVKRAVEPADGGWLLASDNPFVDGPSGVADVEARVLLRYWPLPVRRLS
jgi:phage repressor protein C with HTH and peptisase S24 domain